MNYIRSTFYTSFSKRLLISLLAIGMAGHLTGCAMGDSSDEATADGGETFAEESVGDFEEDGEVADGDEAPADGEESTEVAEADGAEGEDVALEGDDLSAEVAESAEGDGGDDMALEDDAAAGDLAANEGDDELSLDDEEGLPADIASSETAPTDMAEPAPAIEEPPTAPTDAPVFADNSTDLSTEAPPTEGLTDGMSAATDVAVATEAPTWVPVKKVKSAAFMVGDANLNRVYLARAGETRPDIAQKIYGDKSRSKDLLKWNGFLARGVKVGDKIYYSSPTNPTDTSMLTYYEDVGIPAQNYVSRDGDNIREVSRTLLGDKDSWKEVWATNPDVESKGDIASGMNLRYWSADAVAPETPAPVLAHNDDHMAPPADTMVQDPLAQNPPAGPGVSDPLNVPPADVLAPNDPVAQLNNMDPAAQQLQDPTMADPMAQPTGTPASIPPAIGTTELPPAPPMDPPAAPAEPKVAAAEPTAHSGTEEADDMMMMGLAGIILLAAGAVFVLMRRNRSRKVDLTQTTQVG